MPRYEFFVPRVWFLIEKGLSGNMIPELIEGKVVGEDEIKVDVVCADEGEDCCVLFYGLVELTSFFRGEFEKGELLETKKGGAF